VIWVIWAAMQTGVPAKPAANVAKLAPGLEPEFSLAGCCCPRLLATLAWLWLVRWRTGATGQALWKSLVLPAGGWHLCWLLLMTLWLPLLDYGRSYGADLARRIASLVPAGSLRAGAWPQAGADRRPAAPRAADAGARRPGPQRRAASVLVVDPGRSPRWASAVDLVLGLASAAHRAAPARTTATACCCTSAWALKTQRRRR
jgi:hypothetical protein